MWIVGTVDLDGGAWQDSRGRGPIAEGPGSGSGLGTMAGETPFYRLAVVNGIWA